MSKDYLISGVFEKDDFSIEFPVKSIKASTDDEAKEIGQHMDLGEIVYNVKSRILFHNYDGNVTAITKQNEKVRFELLEPRKNFKHETLLGVPIMDSEDYKQLSFLEWEKMLYGYCRKNELELFCFGEAIGYMWERMIELHDYKKQPTLHVGKPICEKVLEYQFDYKGSNYRVEVELDNQNVPLICIFELDDKTVKYIGDSGKNLYLVFGKKEITEKELIRHCNEYLERMITNE